MFNYTCHPLGSWKNPNKTSIGDAASLNAASSCSDSSIEVEKWPFSSHHRGTEGCQRLIRAPRIGILSRPHAILIH